nr:YrhK family protein [Nesterenkonia sandarakina]
MKKETIVAIFSHENPPKSPRDVRIYAAFELLYTGLDVGASIMFLTGSILFFSGSTMTAGTVCFLVGSLFFLAKPVSRFIRELIFTRTNTGIQELADRATPGLRER